MANTYTFTLRQKHHHTVDNQLGVVYSVDWTLTANNGAGKTATLLGSTAVSYSTNNFIELEELADAEVIQWILDNTPQDTLETHYSNLDNQLIYNL
jgi:hypothetical protein